ILLVAARLFGQRGFAATSTREIAAAAGLRQPSLFHHFASKEAILEALLDRALADSLAFAEAQARARGAPRVRLYRAIAFDVRHLSGFSLDLAAIVLCPEARSPRFARFWAERARLVGAIRVLVRAGIRSGEFIDLDPALATDALFGMVEATVTWVRRGRRRSPEQAAGSGGEPRVRPPPPPRARAGAEAR